MQKHKICKCIFEPFSTQQGQTPIFGATRSGNLSTVKALCERISINGVIHQDQNGSTPLHLAAEYGHADVIEYFIRLANTNNKQIIDICDNTGKTALHLASENGKTNSMAALLEWGSDVDTQDHAGWSPLHSAAGNNQMAAVKLLTQYHAFLNAMDYSVNRETPLDCAYNNNAEDIVTFFMAQDALIGEEIKHLAASKIQINWRNYIRKKKLEKQQFLFSKAEYLRRDAAEIRRIRIESQSKSENINTVMHNGPIVSATVQKPPNPFTVSTGTQTANKEKKMKTHGTQTSKRMAKQTEIEIICFPRIPSPDQSASQKLFEYSGESSTDFIDSCHQLSGMRSKIKRQILARQNQNKKAQIAATIIQKWWRQKKNFMMSSQNADGVSKTQKKEPETKRPQSTKNRSIKSKLTTDLKNDSKNNSRKSIRVGKSKKSSKVNPANICVTSEDIRSLKKIPKSASSTRSSLSESTTRSSLVTKRRRYNNKIQPLFWPVSLDDIYGKINE